MKRISVLFFAAIVVVSLNAQSSYTVQSHDHVDMTWYSNYDRWAAFPDTSESFRKIILHYDMGCATGGCSPWDYTTQVFLRHRTGEYDSTLQQQASFTVNGSVVDPFYFTMDSTYTTFYDSTAMLTDSLPNASLMIVLYTNPSNPQQPTDTIWGFAANYWNYNYNSSGLITDSSFVSADSVWNVTYLPWYNVFEVIEHYELARVITPYGGNLNNSFSFIHDFDVTDFEKLLRDSVEIRVFYSGWSSGFSATLDFEFFPGTPPREVISMQNIYQGNPGYPNSSNFETNFLYPKNVFITPSTQAAKIRMTTTGHGFDNNLYAAEFFDMSYSVKIDNVLTHTQRNWRDDCGENPIYPDYETSSSYVHTWLLDRANWCPGLKAHTHEHEITSFITANDSVNINVDFPNYTWSGTQQPSYTIEAQLVQYGDPNFTHDVELLRIIAPTDHDEFARLNPICTGPRVLIRNYGSAPLTSCVIDYHIDGGPTESYTWNGNLSFLDTVSVTLPIQNIPAFYTSTTGVLKFYAEVSQPNGITDEYPANNELVTNYTELPTYPQTFIVNFRTNLMGNESAWKITDENGNVVYQRNNMANSTTYNDTVTLPDGCYVFEVTDSEEDGLYFYYNNSGTGYCRFKNIGSGYFKVFNPNFGSKYVQHFKTGYLFGEENTDELSDLRIYPNPSDGNFFVDLSGFDEGEVQISLIDLTGRSVFSVNQFVQAESIIPVQTQSISPGIYIVQISGNGIHHSQRIIIHR